MYFYKSYILPQRTSSRFIAAGSIFFVLYELVSTVLNFFFTKRCFSFTLHRVLFPLVLAPTWCIFMTAPKSQNLCQKVFKRFCMPSKSVMKVNIMKLKCLFENKRLTIIFKNLNCSSKVFDDDKNYFQNFLKRRQKDVKKCPFFLGTNGPILNVQKTFTLRRVPTGGLFTLSMTLPIWISH